MFGRVIDSICNWFRDPQEHDASENSCNETKDFMFSEHADEIMVDGQGIALRRGDQTRYFSHQELDVVLSEITDEDVLGWLLENEIGQVDNPDYLPYDRRSGF